MQHLQAYRDVLNDAFVVVVTTNSNERKAVLAVLDAHRKLTTSHISNRAYLGVADNRIVVVLDGDGAFVGLGAASRFVSDFLANDRYPRPAGVVLCGVCWGNPRLTSIGQVLVGGTVISVNRAIAESSGGRTIQPKTFACGLPEDFIEAFADDGVIAPALILSLEQLYKSTAARNELLQQFPLAHGGEMEGFAVVPSCERKSIPWLVIKGVSDLGNDDFGRLEQPELADKAARVLLKGLSNWPHGVQYNEKQNEGLLQLADVIRGHSFELRRELFNFGGNLALQVNNALRGLESVVGFYTGSSLLHPALAAHLSRAVKEIALNALKHGQAKSVRIDVDPHGVSLDDDGKVFSLDDLSSANEGRGGQLAWRTFCRDHLGRLKVSNVPRTKWQNSIRFEITNAHPNLPDTKLKCRAIVELLVRPAIYVHPECSDIYVDIRKIEMMTLALDTVEEFQPLLESGKKLFVALTDPDIREKIESAFPNDISTGQLVFLQDDPDAVVKDFNEL